MLMECGLHKNREKSLKISQIPEKTKEALCLTLELVDKSLKQISFLFKEDSLYLIVKICSNRYCNADLITCYQKMKSKLCEFLGLSIVTHRIDNILNIIQLFLGWEKMKATFYRN